MPSAALQAIRRKVAIEWPQSAQANAKQFLIQTAQAGHDRIIREQTQRAAVVPEWTAYANTPGNLDLSSVKLPGPIVYKYRYFREIVLTAVAALRNASPVASGAYRDAHTVYVDGSPVALNAPVQIGPGQTIIIANPVPYARRLEIGKTESGRDFLISVPNRIYERVAKNVLIPRYRNSAKITFGYASIRGAHTIKGNLSATYVASNGRRRKRHQRVGEAVQAPAIFISAL